MHEGHHGILEDPKNGQQAHDHGHDHHHHARQKAGADLWMKVVAGVVVAGLIILFSVWRLM